MSKTCRGPNQEGFLLGEALIALSILTIGLMAVSEAMATAQRARRRANGESMVAACAQEHLVSMVAGRSLQQTNCTALTWKEERTPVSPDLTRTVASLAEPKQQEVLFETVIPSQE